MKEIIFGIIGFTLQAYIIYLVFKKIKKIVLNKEKRELLLINISVWTFILGGIYAIWHFFPNFVYMVFGLMFLAGMFSTGGSGNISDTYNNRENENQRASREAEDAVTASRIANEINNRPSY